MLDVESRLAIFKAFIISNFNYCPIVWHFCEKVNASKMERIQKRALRFVFNDLTSSYDILLDRAGVTILTLSRIKTIAAEVYKASNDLSPHYIADMFYPRAETQHNLRNTNLLTLPKVKTVKYGKNSLLFEGVKIWNHLPNDIRIAKISRHSKTFWRFGLGVTVQYAPDNFYYYFFYFLAVGLYGYSPSQCAIYHLYHISPHSILYL